MAAAEGRVAIVTGAVSGIGEELSRGMVAQGWKVAAIDLPSQVAAADELSNELGDAFLFIPCDVTKYDQLAKAFSTTFGKWGHIDAFCSNAGFVDKSSVYIFDRRGKTEWATFSPSSSGSGRSRMLTYVSQDTSRARSVRH